MLSVKEGGAGGHGGAVDVRSTLARPESVTLDFILRLDLVEFTIALSVETFDSGSDWLSVPCRGRDLVA